MPDFEKEDSPAGENRCFRDIIMNLASAIDIVAFNSPKYSELKSILMDDPVLGDFDVVWKIRDLANDFTLDLAEAGIMPDKATDTKIEDIRQNLLEVFMMLISNVSDENIIKINEKIVEEIQRQNRIALSYENA